MTELQPCGHPVECIVGSDEGTSYCGWCALQAQLQSLLEHVMNLVEAAGKCEDMVWRSQRHLRALGKQWADSPTTPDDEDTKGEGDG